MTDHADHPDGKSAFWDERFQHREPLFGAAPNAFVATQALRLPQQARVLELGAGDGRNAVFLARHGHDVTVVDFSAEALEQAQGRADDADVALHLVQADVRDWIPSQTYDAIVATYVQLLPDERPALWRLVQKALAPGGLFIGVFFRPEQRTEGYTSGGPPTLERMITAGELRDHFREEGFLVLEVSEVELDEGMMRGPAAVLHVVWKHAGAA